MNNDKTTLFAGFSHSPATLSAYIYSAGLFVISLKNSKELLQYEPDDAEAFCKWLDDNGVRNVNATLGKMVHGNYFGSKAKGEK